MKKAIVTGAGGFIGGALTKLLLSKGVTVYGVDISEKALVRYSGKENFVPIVADFTKYDHLHEMIRGDIDVFYHFAWDGAYGPKTADYSRITGFSCPMPRMLLTPYRKQLKSVVKNSCSPEPTTNLRLQSILI